MNRNALNRITTLAISWVVMLTAGSLFTFSSFARGFEERLKLDSSQMNLISGIGMAGLYVPCLFMGILYDKYGARITMAVGTLAFSLGYLLMWVVFDKMRSFQYSFILIAILYFITGIGSSAGYIVCVALNIFNFPYSQPGSIFVVGSLMLTYGLSGTVFSQIYSGFFAKILDAQSATSAFLLFLAVFVGVVNGSASFFMAKADTDLKEIVLMEPQIEKQKEDSSLHSSSSSPSTPCNNYITNEFTSSRQMLTSVVFYVYIMIFIWQQGSAYINNLSSIVTSSQTRPMDDDDLDRKVSLQLTLVSIFQAASRFIFAIVADFIGKLKSSSHSSVSRFVNGALLLIIAQLINLSPHLLLAFGGGNVSSLVLNSCSALIGLGYGMAGSLAAIVTREIFGTRIYGTAIGFSLVFIPIGIIVSNQIYGSFADAEAARQGSSSDCMGSGCFETSFRIFSGMQLGSILFSVILYILMVNKKSDLS